MTLVAVPEVFHVSPQEKSVPTPPRSESANAAALLVRAKTALRFTDIDPYAAHALRQIVEAMTVQHLAAHLEKTKERVR